MIALVAGATLALAAAQAAKTEAGDEGPPAAGRCADPVRWPHWEAYARHFIQPDGRVVDRTDGHRSTSEGQAYGLFFALVFNDRPQFERILRWTTDNLAGGDLTARLPAWLWGESGDGEGEQRTWGVKDTNPAADADLWLAYALLEAGRLWGDARYDRLARAVLAQVVAREIVSLPELGAMLLPAPAGFEVEPGKAWRLNPSYLPIQLLRRFAEAGVAGPWTALTRTTVRLVAEASPHGLVPDWSLYRDGLFLPDPQSGPVGSYDAIRVYLWAGMLPADEPLRRRLLEATGGLLAHAGEGQVPERVKVLEPCTSEGRGPPGFLAALLPAARTEAPAALPALQAALARTLADGLYGSEPAYYDQNLVLFGRAFIAGLYRFDRAGRLQTSWSNACDAQRR